GLSWSAVDIPSITAVMETCFPSPRSYQLQISSFLSRWELCAYFPFALCLAYTVQVLCTLSASMSSGGHQPFSTWNSPSSMSPPPISDTLPSSSST
ncbi:mCG145510, partial [Mus musculus]